MTILPQRDAETEALERECELLRDELARLLVERARLLEVVAPALEARYYLRLGALQLEVLRLECEVRRLRRKLELMWEALNHDRTPDPRAIEVRLDDELADWRVRLAQESAKLNWARERFAAPLSMSAADSRELLRLFRALAKRCHPDANPEGGDRARQLWHQASDAYARRDLESLRALALLADGLADPEPLNDVASALRQRRDALQTAIAQLLAEIEEIQRRFPFTIRQMIDDPEWVAGKRAELEQKRAALTEERLRLIAALTRIPDGTAND